LFSGFAFRKPILGTVAPAATILGAQFDDASVMWHALCIMDESSPRRARKAPKKLTNKNVSARRSDQFSEGTGPGTLAIARDLAFTTALEAAGGNRALAASILGVSPRAVFRWLASKKTARAAQEGAAL
jgi:transcriptional regulator with PAS, ATPase and Fis domain